MSAELLVETRGSTVVLTISNPGAKNALAPEMYRSFLAGFAAAEQDSQIRAIVLTGADGVFCAGGNLNRLLGNRDLAPAVQAESIDNLHAMTRALAASSKPVIAAVEGAAAGAGLSLALGCDLMVAGQSARFVMAYVNVGLTPDGGGSWLTTRNLPRQSAAEMLLEGGSWSAQRLHELGLVNRVVTDGAALESALGWADALAMRSPNAIAGIKVLMRGALGNSLEQHLEQEKASFVAALHHPDAGEAIAAFLQKRAARFP